MQVFQDGSQVITSELLPNFVNVTFGRFSCRLGADYGSKNLFDGDIAKFSIRTQSITDYFFSAMLGYYMESPGWMAQYYESPSYNQVPIYWAWSTPLIMRVSCRCWVSTASS